MLNASGEHTRGFRLSSIVPFALTVLLLAFAYRGARWFQDMARSAPPTPTFAAPPPALQPPLSSWPHVSYLEVRAYYSDVPAMFNLSSQGIPDVVKDKEGVLLDREQERRLVSAVTTNVKPYEPWGCWYPRHAFVFYGPFGKPVAEVDVCFDCSMVMRSPVEYPDLDALAKLVADLGLPLGPEQR